MRSLSRFLALVCALLLAAPAVEAAVALASIQRPERQALATTWTEITWPSGTEYLRVEVPASTTVYFDSSCTDGGAVGSDYETWQAGTSVPLVVTRAVDGIGRICLAASTGTPTVALTALKRGR